MIKKVICSMPGCSKCNTLKAQNPDVDVVEFEGDDMLTLLAFARLAGIKSMPFILMTSDNTDELSDHLKA